MADRVTLLTTLKNLNSSEFDEILFHVRFFNIKHVSDNASQTQKAIALINEAEQKNYLRELQQTIEVVTDISFHNITQQSKDTRKGNFDDSIIPLNLPYLMNYYKQQAVILELIAKHHHKKNPCRSQPLVCVLHGQEDIMIAGGLIHRIKADTEKLVKSMELYHRDEMKIKAHLFDIRNESDLDSHIIGGLCSRISQNIDISNPIIFDNPVLLFYAVEKKYLTPKMLKDFHAFWRKKCWSEQNHLFLVFLFVCYQPHFLLRTFLKRQSLTCWLEKYVPTECLIPELLPISASTVYSWAHLEEIRNYLNPYQFRELLAGLNELFPDDRELPMHILGHKLDNLLIEIIKNHR